MGAFLNVGVALAVKTNCKAIEYMEQMRNDICKVTKLPLEDYVIVRDEEGYFHFTLKDDCYGDNLVKFMLEQTTIAHRMSPTSLELLAKVKSFNDLKNIEHTLKLDPFQLFSFEKYKIKCDDGSAFIISVFAVAYAQDGKILLEQGEWIFEYFEHNIRLQPNPIAKYVKISII